MERKTMMGLAAVGALVLLLYMRKSTATAATGATAAVGSGSLGSSNSWTSALAGLLSNTGRNTTTFVNNKLPVVDTTAKAPAPSPAPAPAPVASGGAVFGGTVNGASSAPQGHVNDKGEWVYPDGSVYRGPSVSGSQAMAIMGF